MFMNRKQKEVWRSMEKPNSQSKNWMNVREHYSDWPALTLFHCWLLNSWISRLKGFVEIKGWLDAPEIHVLSQFQFTIFLLPNFEEKIKQPDGYNSRNWALIILISFQGTVDGFTLKHNLRQQDSILISLDKILFNILQKLFPLMFPWSGKKSILPE